MVEHLLWEQDVVGSNPATLIAPFHSLSAIIHAFEHGTPAYGWTFPAQSRITGYQVRDGVAIIKAVRSVHLIDVATGEQLTQPIDVGASASFVDLDRDGGRLLVDTVGAGVRLYDLDEWREPHAAPIALTSGRSMRLAPDGMLAVCANWDPHFLLEAGGILLIDPLCGVEVARLLEPGVSGHPLAIDPSGSHFATVTSVRGSAQATRTLVVWSLRSGRRLWTKSLADTPHWFEWSLRFNEDGSRVVLAPFEYDALDGRQRAGPELATDVSAEYLIGRSEPERSLDIRYAGLASSSWLEVIRRDTGETVQRFEAPESFLLPHARISNEETLIAIPQRQAPVRVYEIETGRLIGALPDYTTDTLRIEWSPDDSVFATVGEDAVVRLWNGESLVLLAVLSGHTSYIQEVAFAPDNRSLYTISGDGSFRTWNTRTSAQQADFVAARRVIHDRLRPKVARIVDESVREDAADAWAALAALGLQGEDADVGHLILTGMLLERFGQ